MGYSPGLAAAGARDTGYGIRDMGYSPVPPPRVHVAGYGIWLRAATGYEGYGPRRTRAFGHGNVGYGI